MQQKSAGAAKKDPTKTKERKPKRSKDLALIFSLVLGPKIRPKEGYRFVLQFGGKSS